MTITLDTVHIRAASMGAFSVGTSGTIDDELYNIYLEYINTRLSKDGLLTSTGELKTGCEYLAALLICDLIKSGQTQDTGIIEESFGGGEYKYKKTQAAAELPISKFMQRYEAELKMRNRGAAASSGQVRSDYEIEFAKLTQGPQPSVENTSDDYPNGM